MYFKVIVRNQHLSKRKKKLMQFLKMSRLLHFQVFLWRMFNTTAPGKGQKEDKILSQVIDCLGEATQHIVVPDKFDCILSAQKFLHSSKSKTTFPNTSKRKSKAVFVVTDFNLWYMLKEAGSCANLLIMCDDCLDPPQLFLLYLASVYTALFLVSLCF